MSTMKSAKRVQIKILLRMNHKCITRSFTRQEQDMQSSSIRVSSTCLLAQTRSQEPMICTSLTPWRSSGTRSFRRLVTAKLTNTWISCGTPTKGRQWTSRLKTLKDQKLSIASRKQGQGLEQFPSATVFTFLVGIQEKVAHTSMTSFSTTLSRSSGMSSKARLHLVVRILTRSENTRFQRLVQTIHL